MSAAYEMYGIFISRGGIPPGPPLPLDEAKRSVAKGQLHSDQLAWARGLGDWKPLHEVITYVEKKTSQRLPAQRSEPVAAALKAPSAPAEMPPVKLAPPPALQDQKPEPPPVRDPAVSKKPTPQKQVSSAPRAIVRTEVVASGEQHAGLWTFAKQCTREFRSLLERQFAQDGVSIHEDLEFNFSQEVLILHLWLIAKVIGTNEKPVEAMNRKYIHRQSEIAQTYEHHWEQVEYMRAAKEIFLQRLREYQRLWNEHMPRAQTMVAGHLLKNILGPSTACTKPAENLLISFINSYLTKMPRAIAAYYEETEKKG